jgi:GT2 family glycosyltransferase
LSEHGRKPDELGARLDGATTRVKVAPEHAWGTSLRQRIRLSPLYIALLAADRAATPPVSANIPSASWRPGISVVIPERDAPEMLAVALQSAQDALADINEPSQIIVVVNGASLRRYDAIVARFPSVEILHDEQPLGFSEAIHRGLSRVRHDWTFLMNNDMTLERGALSELLCLRDNDVFALACQIFQQSADGRREETGLTDWYVNAAGVQIFHADPGTDTRVREHLCASGGAALFRTAPLRRYVGDSRCYDPFYWEDVEWGVRAQRDGMRVLFCPQSHAHHLHRMSTTRFFSETQVARIVERNRVLFDARNGITDFGADWLMQRVCDLDYDAQRKFSRLGLASSLFARRRRVAPGNLKRPPRTVDAAQACVVLRSSYSYRLRATTTTRPRRPVVVIATPFCVFPARHGGARRIQGLLKTLKNDFDIVLVTDEASLYDARSFPDFDELLAVYLVQRPGEASGRPSEDIAKRMATHCHSSLVDAMQMALTSHSPAIVQIEYAELSALSRLRSAGQHWVLGLHDAYASTDFRGVTESDRFQAGLRATYDAVTVCSAEDQVLVSHPHVVCVPNASSVDSGPYVPSQSLRLLFMGPFRYTQNFDGVRAFLEHCFPAIASAVPGVELFVLGGDGAREKVAGDALFDQAGVRVFDHRDDVAQLLSSCALTINPLQAIRGSSIKVIESLVAGRICVTTDDGARGFAGDGLAGLVVVPEIALMAAPLVELLRDPAKRHQIERPQAAAFARYRWPHSAGIQATLYRSLLEQPSRTVL